MISRNVLSYRDFQRKLFNWFMIGILTLAACVAIAPLVSVFVYILEQGLSALDLDFFTQTPAPVGEWGGGIANAIVGTFILVLLASIVGIPWGIAVGVYLSEYGRGKLATFMRFAIDLLTGIPSIIVGLFAYAVLVKPMGNFSAYAGGAALAIIMIPTVARTTEELLRLVPTHIREAGLALGIPRWKVILRIVLKGSRNGITTGIMLAIARASGETAPLLFTSLNNQFWARSLDQPIASLPVQIYTYAISPYEEWHKQAWAAALLLLLFVFLLNLATRAILRSQPIAKD